jgi:hypothetical protein
LLGFLCVSGGGGAGGDAGADNGQGSLNAGADTDNGQSTFSLNADAVGNAVNNEGDAALAAEGSVDDENTSCFLGLICFTATANSAGATEPPGAMADAATSADGDGLQVDADSDSSVADNDQTGLLESWWQGFVNLFASAVAGN